MSEPRLGFRIEGLATELHVTRIHGHEGLSELFAFDVDLVCDDAALALEELVGERCTLTFEAAGHRRTIVGIVGRLEQGDDADDTTTYAATVVPEVARLDLRHDCRVFAEVTVPDVVQKVLAEAKVTRARFQLRRSYPVIEHCIQYRESDWSFVSRLLEREGIFYFFHEEDGETVLVFGDDPAAHPTIGTIDVVTTKDGGGLLAGERLSRFRLAEGLRPDRVALRGQSFKNPLLPLTGDAEAASRARIEVFDDLDGAESTEAPDPAFVARRARQRLEQLQVDRRVASARASSPRFVPGHVFALADHPRPSWNQRYLATRVVHTAAQPTPGNAGVETSYLAELVAIPADVPFRPLARTPRPRVEGSHTAVVVGPKGEEIYTDAFGRVRVQFHWDRRGARNEKSSCWIRVAQLWAGSGWGSMHVPRVGQEVLVDFLGGDLDRPIIVGGLYHATNVPPYALPANRTVSTIKSSSTEGGEGSNEIRFEDARGMEELYLHAERDLTTVVENDRHTTIEQNDALDVEGERRVRVGKSETVAVAEDETITVGGVQTLTVRMGRTASVGADDRTEVTGNATSDVRGNLTQVVGKHLSLQVEADKNEAVREKSHETVGGDKHVDVEGKIAVAAGKDHRLAVGGSDEEDIARDKTVTVGRRITFVAGESRIVLEKNGAIVIEGSDIAIRSENPLKLEGASLSVRSTGAVRVAAEGPVAVRGARVNVN